MCGCIATHSRRCSRKGRRLIHETRLSWPSSTHSDHNRYWNAQCTRSVSALIKQPCSLPGCNIKPGGQDSVSKILVRLCPRANPTEECILLTCKVRTKGDGLTPAPFSIKEDEEIGIWRLIKKRIGSNAVTSNSYVTHLRKCVTKYLSHSFTRHGQRLAIN